MERGEYLVRGPTGCGNCHTPMGPEGFIMDQELAGRLVEDNPAFTAYRREHHARGAHLGMERRRTRPRDPRRHPARRHRHRAADAVHDVPRPRRRRPHVDRGLPAHAAGGRERTPASVYNIPLPPAYGPPVDSVDRAAARRDGRIRRLPRRAGLALHGVPHADGTAGAASRDRPRPRRVRVPRTVGHVGRGEPDEPARMGSPATPTTRSRR